MSDIFETVADTVTDRVFVTIEGVDVQYLQETVGINFDMTESEIMSKITPIILEEKGVDISDSFKVRKTLNNRNIFVIPNSTAGV